MRSPVAYVLTVVVVAAALPARAEQDDWEDIGDATLEEDAKPPKAEPAPEAPKEPAPAAPGDFTTAQLVSAGVSAALLAFAGTAVGIALAFTTGAFLTLLPNSSFRDYEVWVWLGFWTLPALGSVGGAAFGSLGAMEPLGVGAVATAAAVGTGLGALLGWGVGWGIGLVGFGGGAFPADNGHTFSMATGILLGAALGAASGAAATAPFFVPGVLEAMTAE